MTRSLRIILGFLVIAGLIAFGVYYWGQNKTGLAQIQQVKEEFEEFNTEFKLDEKANVLTGLANPLQIETMRRQEYPGSEIVIEETLSAGSNYKRYRVSYQSDGLKIYALMTIPNGTKPENGWPVVVFNHGYIPPDQYRTTERYISYVDSFARNGYIVFKSDYRGHGDSEGEARGGYGSPDYTVDVLNAVGSLKKHPDVDESKMGMWGHSMGGYITLRSMVINNDIKAGVIWGGVVADYAELLSSWRRGNRNPSPTPSPTPGAARRWREMLVDQFGSPDSNPGFWDSISANAYVKDISGPIQLHHAKGDASVPWEFSQNLADDLQAANKTVDLHLYEGDDHDITRNFSTAMRDSVAWFDKYVKGQ